MKNLIILFIFFPFAASIILAQNEHSIISEKSIWTSIDCFRIGTFESKMVRKEMMSGDTIINGIAYKKIYRDTSPVFNWNTDIYTCAIRESNRKVYYIAKDELKENLLYDFSKNAGEYVEVIGLGLNYPNPIRLKVDSVSIKNINGVNRKIMKFNANGSYHTDEIWIEGIGSSFGFLTPFVSVSDNYFQLKCCSKNDTLYYLNSQIGNFLCSPSEPQNQCEYTVIAHSNEQEWMDLSILPNPANDFLNIKTNIDGLTYTIYNSIGQKILFSNLQDDKISTTDLPSGIYIITFEKGQKRKSLKMVVVH